ncbi:MAG: hypothetical protein RLZZ271_900 [Pseudomonadota bacterium]|jgi:putative peptide zinc metalloprotease protein
MTGSLFSSSWYRVCKLKPCLRTQARIVRHTYRGQRWYVLQDLGSGRFVRFQPSVYRILALMDGQRTLEDIWLTVCELLGDEAPTQDDVVNLMSQLHQANVLRTDKKPDLEEINERREKSKKAKFKQYFSNPLSIKIPLFNPDKFVSWFTSSLPDWFWRVLPWLWVALVGSAIVLAALSWNELAQDMTAQAFSAENLLSMALIFPVLKAIHEFGHCIALKRYGCTTNEVGLMFLIFVPIPYVEASQAVSIKDKRQRMMVGLAGMAIELAVAAVALWLWSGAQPGLLKAMLHQTLILASFTTVVFNANPLLRFDGYYVLADWLEIPNLSQKANQYFFHLFKKHAFKTDSQPPDTATPSEPGILVSYSIAAFVYRTLVTVGIILFASEHVFLLGVLIAIWAGWGAIGAPLQKFIQYLLNDQQLAQQRQRAVATTLSVCALVLAFIAFVPVPSWTMTEGVIWMPEQSRVRIPIPCFGDAVLAKPGSHVAANTRLLTCTEPEIDAMITRTKAQLSEQQARLQMAQVQDRVQLQIAMAERDHLDAQLADMEARRGEMTLVSHHAGEFVMSAPADFPGRYFNRGDVVGYVLDPKRFTLLTVVPQGEVDLVRSRTRNVELRSVDRVWEPLAAKVVREVPAATTELPSMALALQGGGRIGLDPTAGPDSQVPKALNPLFQFELAFTGDRMPQALGNRVHVRFVHETEPLLRQWYRAIRQQFLKRFAA